MCLFQAADERLLLFQFSLGVATTFYVCIFMFIIAFVTSIVHFLYGKFIINMII